MKENKVKENEGEREGKKKLTLSGDRHLREVRKVARVDRPRVAKGGAKM